MEFYCILSIWMIMKSSKFSRIINKETVIKIFFPLYNQKLRKHISTWWKRASLMKYTTSSGNKEVYRMTNTFKSSKNWLDKVLLNSIFKILLKASNNLQINWNRKKRAITDPMNSRLNRISWLSCLIVIRVTKRKKDFWDLNLNRRIQSLPKFLVSKRLILVI